MLLVRRIGSSRVESARVELASPGCRPGALPLSYDPAGCEGIEPPLRGLEARPVAMTLQPVGAARRGVEPLSHRRRRRCDCRSHHGPMGESPRPESNRTFPLTGRALVHTSLEGMPRLQRKESNLRVNRLTAGCLTIRLRWNTWTEGHGADPWPSVVRRRVVNERCSARAQGRSVSGAGIEPALPGPEASVLPLDDPEVRVGPEALSRGHTIPVSPGKLLAQISG